MLILLKDWKRTKQWKNWILEVYFFKQLFFVDHFSGCKIKSEGMKSLSSFLSQDGIVLEELEVGLKEKEETLHFNIKQVITNLEMKVVFILLKDWKRIKLWNNWTLNVFLQHFFVEHFQNVKSLLKEWNQFPVFFLKMELFLKNWI